MTSYRLRCNLVGHEKDVRALSPLNVTADNNEASSCNEAIVSGSRDVTARVWNSNEDDNSFTEGNILSGHSGFVATVCVLPGNETHPKGLIATGSNDKTIHVYSFDSPVPLYKLEGHTDTVCSLAAGKHGMILSGSWDKTAKVWLNRKSVMTLSGHTMAVWCVAVMPEDGYMVTGSADKLIKVWRAGKCVETLRGHDDCVRGLAVVHSKEFLSCSNDSTIRKWSISGHILHVYYSHMNYVYGIALFPNSTTDFVSVGEDRTLKIWRNGDCVQTISHPTTSVWCVCVLANGDIVTGASDNTIRVFTADETRMASSEDIKAFEELVSASEIPTQVGDIDSSTLPGPEALFEPGKKDGATKMVKVGNDVEAHQWSAAEYKWVKVGKVVGSSGGNSKSRQLYQGKEYDFVFTVDVQEGQPPLNLPYNMTEDPWDAARRFLITNDLPMAYLEEVHAFIVKNSKSVTMNQQSAHENYRDPFTGGSSYVPGATSMDTAGTYSDPFTGSGRYVPSGSGSTPQSNAVSTQGADPFTGAGSYRPADVVKEPATNSYFPLNTVLTFNQIKPEVVAKKLKELNKELPGDMRCEDGDLDVIVGLCDVDKTPVAAMLTYLWRLLQWPDDKVFPCIDILRMALRNPVVNEHFCNSSQGPQFLTYLVKYLDSQQSTINQTLALRAICNLMSLSNGQDLILANCEDFLPLVVKCGKKTDKNLQVAASTVLMDIAVLLKSTDNLDGKSEVLSALLTLADCVVHSEACFRLCTGLGTLLWKDDDMRVMTESLNARFIVQKWSKSSELKKLTECATYVDGLFS